MSLLVYKLNSQINNYQFTCGSVSVTAMAANVSTVRLSGQKRVKCEKRKAKPSTYSFEEFINGKYVLQFNIKHYSY